MFPAQPLPLAAAQPAANLTLGHAPVSGKNGSGGLAIYGNYGYDLNSNLNTAAGDAGSKESDYLKKALNQVLLGNYTDDVTALGTLGQILLGLTGLDTATDVRDLTYDLTHWEWSPQHVGQTLLDAIGFIPGIGAVKNADEVGTLLKGLLGSAAAIYSGRNIP